MILSPIKVNIDIKRDIKNYLLAEQLSINNLNINFQICTNEKELQKLRNLKLEQILNIYYLLTDRFIKKQKYNVFLSKELKENSLFNKFSEQIYKIKNLLEEGKSIRPFLSAEINNFINTSDLLLEDWGIHHLHFDESLYKSKNRTKEILFIKVNNNDIYFINIFNHLDWYNFECLKIIYNNWKYLLDPYKIIDVKPNVFTSKQLKLLRKTNVCYCIGFNINDTFGYSPMINEYGIDSHNLKQIKLIEEINRTEQLIKYNNLAIFKQLAIHNIKCDELNINIIVDKNKHILKYYDKKLNIYVDFNNTELQKILIFHNII